MKFRYDLGGGQSTVRSVMVHTGGTNALKVGAAVKVGGAYAVVAAASSLADVKGVLQAGDPATPDSSLSTPIDLRAKVLINPLAVFLAEYDQTSTLTATSSSGATVTIANLVAVAGDWVYVVSGTGIGQLIYVATGGTGSFTASVAPSPALDGTSTVIHVLGQDTEGIGLTADGTKLATTAAAPTGAGRVVGNFISAPSLSEIELDPVLHGGITVPNAHLLSEIIFTDHAYNVSA